MGLKKVFFYAGIGVKAVSNRLCCLFSSQSLPDYTPGSVMSCFWHITKYGSVQHQNRKTKIIGREAPCARSALEDASYVVDKRRGNRQNNTSFLPLQTSWKLTMRFSFASRGYSSVTHKPHHHHHTTSFIITSHQILLFFAS